MIIKPYIFRKVLNTDPIVEFMDLYKVDTRDPIKDLHVTCAYSKKEVEFEDIELDKSIVEVKDINQITKFGDYWVLLINSNFLQERFKFFEETGFSYDYNSYRPHISFSKSDKDIITKPFSMNILLGPENCHPLEE